MVFAAWDLWHYGGFYGSVEIGPFCHYSSNKLGGNCKKRYSEIKRVVQYIEERLGEWEKFENVNTHTRIQDSLPHEMTCKGGSRTYACDSNKNSVGSWYKIISKISKHKKKKIKRKRKIITKKKIRRKRKVVTKCSPLSSKRAKSK